MTSQSACPSCGAPLSFRPGAMVAVCSYCKALCARTDRDPKLIGKVADLVDTGSPLALGTKGTYAGRTFALVGRVQMRHPLGGVWNEWYMALEDGRWGWLAEAQGRFYLTFQRGLDVAPPAVEALSPGQALSLGSAGAWVVAEVSEGAFASAEGEIPWEVDLHKSYRFADLSGPESAFATLDFGEDPPLFFSGRGIALEELKLTFPPSSPLAGQKLRAMGLNCPQCGAPLPLKAPDQTLRVACAHCKSLLEASEGKLSFLKSLKQPDADMQIPLGTEGLLHGGKYTCIGYMRRGCVVEGEHYHWGEYLLLDAHHGFKWLVESDGHWNLAEVIPAADVRKTGHNDKALMYQGRMFRRYQDIEAHVEGVYGEFYWKIELGEKAQVAEFVDAPLSLAEEIQQHPGGGAEVNWSRSTYLEGAEVWKAFRLKTDMPVPRGVASNQPNPHKRLLNQMTTWAILAFAAMVLLIFWEAATHRGSILFQRTYDLSPSALAAIAPPTPKSAAPADASTPGTAAPTAESPAEPVFLSDPIEIKSGSKNFELRLSAPVDNSWIGVDGALLNETTGVVELFEVAASYYHGVDGGESWSEGGQTETVCLEGVPPGTYILRLAPQWEGTAPPVSSMTVELRQGVFRVPYVILVFLAIVLAPLLQLFRVMSFEGRRWAESMYGAASSSTGGE